jgi:hypothetical protein
LEEARRSPVDPYQDAPVYAYRPWMPRRRVD